ELVWAKFHLSQRVSPRAHCQADWGRLLMSDSDDAVVLPILLDDRVWPEDLQLVHGNGAGAVAQQHSLDRRIAHGQFSALLLSVQQDVLCDGPHWSEKSELCAIGSRTKVGFEVLEVSCRANDLAGNRHVLRLGTCGGRG